MWGTLRADPGVARTPPWSTVGEIQTRIRGLPGNFSIGPTIEYFEDPPPLELKITDALLCQDLVYPH